MITIMTSSAYNNFLLHLFLFAFCFVCNDNNNVNASSKVKIVLPIIDALSHNESSKVSLQTYGGSVFVHASGSSHFDPSLSSFLLQVFVLGDNTYISPMFSLWMETRAIGGRLAANNTYLHTLHGVVSFPTSLLKPGLTKLNFLVHHYLKGDTLGSDILLSSSDLHAMSIHVKPKHCCWKLCAYLCGSEPRLRSLKTKIDYELSSLAGHKREKNGCLLARG